MTPAEKAAAALAQFTKSMQPITAKLLLDAFAAESAKKDAKPRTALRTALAGFRKTHQMAGEVWAKRDTAVQDDGSIRGVREWNFNTLAGDIDGDGDEDFACKGCLMIQPELACGFCGNPGPGNYCIGCSSPLVFGCPECNKSWAPIDVAEEDESGGMRMACATVQECRVSADKVFGTIRVIVNSSEKDDWGTIISPPAVAARIKPGKTKIDIDHQICRCAKASRTAKCLEHDGFIEGAEITTVTEAKVPYQGKLVDGVIIDTVCDLRMPRAKLLYDGAVDRKYTGASVLLTYPRAVDDAIKAGRTNRIDEVCAVPAITFSGAVSNPVAMVTEIRTSRLFGAKVHDQQEVINPPSAPDPAAAAVESLRKAVESSDQAPAASPPSDAPPVTPAPGDSSAPTGGDQPPAGGAPELTLAVVSERLSALSATVETMRTAAPSKEWESGLQAITARLDALDQTLKTTSATVEGQRTLIADSARLIAKSHSQINTRIQKLTAVPPREGSTGAETHDLTTEALRTLQQEQQAKTKEERKRDQVLDEAERIGQLAVG